MRHINPVFIPTAAKQGLNQRRRMKPRIQHDDKICRQSTVEFPKALTHVSILEMEWHGVEAAFLFARRSSDQWVSTVATVGVALFYTFRPLFYPFFFVLDDHRLKAIEAGRPAYLWRSGCVPQKALAALTHSGVPPAHSDILYPRYALCLQKAVPEKAE